MERKRVGILIFPNVEVLDFCGPYEVFSTTHLSEDQDDPNYRIFELFIVAETASPVRASGGLRVIPDYTIDNCPPLDILVVPGGEDVSAQLECAELIQWIGQCAKKLETVASVCTGSLLLGKAGLLAGRTATTHSLALNTMDRMFPDTNVDPTVRVAHDGNIFTSAGVSAGIDMALRVVCEYFGEDVARRTARIMEYRFPENNNR